MLQVVDTNMLKDPALRAYLSKSRSNKVLVSEMVAVEINKHAAVEATPERLRILCSFPKQVFILRDSFDWLNNHINSAAAARALICDEQTEYFSSFCVSVYEQPQDPRFVAHLNDVEAKSKWHISELAGQSSHLESLYERIASLFTESERCELIARVPFSKSTVKKLLDLVALANVQLLDDAAIDAADRPRNMNEALDTYLFRYALCMVLLYTRWMLGGGKATGKRLDRVTNDVVDMQIAATSTFFGGLLTGDMKPRDVSREARRMLRAINAYVG